MGKAVTTQTVVVTGASAGVGRAIAVAFGRRGCKVVLIARGDTRLAEAADEVRQAGGQALSLPCDVTDANALHAITNKIERDWGPIDIWVNNAMVTIYGAVTDIAREEFEQVTRVTYLGQVYGTQAALSNMRPHGRGTIIFINSALGYRSIPFQAPYCAAKAAVRAFVDALRSELLWEKMPIKLITIYLPAVNTPQFDWTRNKLQYRAAPVPPIFQPEAIGEAVVKAAFTAPREIWLGASTVKAIVGQIVAPGFIDRRFGKKGPLMETTQQSETLSRSDNLFAAGQGPARTHGRFDDQAEEQVIAFNPAWLRFWTGMIASLIGAIALVSTIYLFRT